ncbi:MAG: sialidase family protein [Kiritimatiellae bacterium]|nr:sialidase family protein [Kiritimatiellia bacterium]
MTDKHITCRNTLSVLSIVTTLLLTQASFSQSSPFDKIEDDLLKGFVHPPVNFNPGAEYGLDKRNYQGIPSIERAPNGRLWATWYAGKVWEDKFNYLLAATSDDDGRTWSDVQFVVDPDGDDDRRASDPCLWLDPTGKLWLFWWMNGAGQHVTMSITTANPNDAKPIWSEPRALYPGVMLNKPLVLKNNDWLMPAAIWKSDYGTGVMISKDKGASFSFLGAANVPAERRNCDEHMLVERKDGSLMMLIRTSDHGIGRSFSTDGGKSWSKVEDYLAQTTSRFFVRRLLSGNLLLVKHDGINERGAGRKQLTAYLSEDDGASWLGGLVLDERNSVSYPDGTQAPDGTIYVIYDWERARDKHILMTTFREEDVRKGSYSAAGRERVLINFATGENPRLAKMAAERAAALALKDNADGAELIIGPAARMQAPDVVTAPLQDGALLFTDREYRLTGVPQSLVGKQFIRGSLNNGVVAECVEAGPLYVLTPAPARNRDTVEPSLLQQGFVKAAVPEFVLFGSSAGNTCSVYQKKMKAGEKVKIGKWGVLVF